MEDRSLFLQCLGDTPQLRIIDFFLNNKKSDYSRKEIIGYTGIPVAAFDGVWDGMAGFGCVRATRKYGGEQLYALNPESAPVRNLAALDRELCVQAIPKMLEEPVPQ